VLAVHPQGRLLDAKRTAAAADRMEPRMSTASR